MTLDTGDNTSVIQQESELVENNLTNITEKTSNKIGEILISKGIISDFELKKLLEKQNNLKKEGIIISIGDLIVRNDRIKVDRKKIIDFLKNNGIKLRLLEIVYISSKISIENIEKILNIFYNKQKEGTPVKIGDLLVKYKILSEKELKSLLIEQNIEGKEINKSGFEKNSFQKISEIEAGEVELSTEEFEAIFGKKEEPKEKKIVHDYVDPFGNEPIHPALRGKK